MIRLGLYKYNIIIFYENEQDYQKVFKMLGQRNAGVKNNFGQKHLNLT